MKRKIERMICLFVVLIFFSTMSMTTFASEQGAQPRTVRVGVGFSNALYLDESGKPKGYCVNFIRQIAWLENWDLQYVEVSWPEGLEKMQSGELDLMLPVQMSDKRKKYLDYSKYSGGYESVGLYANAESDFSFNEYEALDGKCIGIESDNMCSQNLDSFAREHEMTYTTKEFSNDIALREALDQGTVDMIVSSTMNEIPNSSLIAIIDYMPFYYCTARGDTELMRELNDGMIETLTTNPTMAVEVYEATMKGTAEIGYTKEEKEVISNTDKITFAMYDNSLPLSGTDESGKPIGIYVDLLKSIEDISGITMEPYVVPVDKNIFDYLYDGTANYVMCSNRLPYAMTDTSKLLGSDAIADYTIVGVSKLNYNPENDENQVIAIESMCSYLEEYIHLHYPEAAIQYYPTTKECMSAVQNDKADLTFVNSWEYNYQSKNVRFRELIQWESARISSNIIVATTMNDDAWLNIVDKAFHKISNEQKDEIISQNVNMAYVSYDTTDRIYDIWNTAKVVFTVVFFLAIMFAMYLHMRKRRILALKEKNRELEETNNKLEMANKAKSVFLSRMSHELRTPLNAIAGYTQDLENNCMSANYNREREMSDISAIRNATRYQTAIIGDLLNVHQIESGKVKLVREDVNASEFMKDIGEMILPEAREKGIHFTYTRLTSTNERYLVDPVRSQQVLFNLLHNAIKFTPSGGTVQMTGEVLEERNNTAHLKFTVSDTGIGMSKDFVETKLFQNFAQEHEGNTSPYEGCGIGLATCKELVDLMGGTISCESTQGKGSVFTVEINAEVVKKKRRERKKREIVTYDLKGIRVLLCEDNKMNQDMEKRILEKMHCEVEIADDGQIGLEKFQQSRVGYYQIILMDIRMPNMDGLEAAKAIRRLEREDANKIPILAVSANAFEEDVKASLNAGMNEHLAKPIEPKLFYDTIVMWLTKKL